MGEFVLEFKDTETLKLSLYQFFRTLEVSDRIESKGPIDTLDQYQVKGIKVVGDQQLPITDVGWWGADSDGTARSKINEILTVLRTHWLIQT